MRFEPSLWKALALAGMTEQLRKNKFRKKLKKGVRFRSGRPFCILVVPPFLTGSL